MQKVIVGRDIFLDVEIENRGIIRRSPYPPSFRRMAASIIEPAMGAST